MLSLHKFDHVINDSTRGCLFILDQSGLTIRAANATLFSILGMREDAIVGTSFLDLIHYNDVTTVKDMVNLHFKTLNFKTFFLKTKTGNPDHF